MTLYRTVRQSPVRAHLPYPPGAGQTRLVRNPFANLHSWAPPGVLRSRLWWAITEDACETDAAQCQQTPANDKPSFATTRTDERIWQGQSRLSGYPSVAR